MGRHGGGAFSGKTHQLPVRLMRPGGLRTRRRLRCSESLQLQVAYALVPHPMTSSLTFGTEQVDPDAIVAAVREVFDLRRSNVRDLDLLRPGYQRTAAYGRVRFLLGDAVDSMVSAVGV